MFSEASGHQNHPQDPPRTTQNTPKTRPRPALGRLLAALGRLGGSPGSSFGPSWPPLGRLWGALGRFLASGGAPGPSREASAALRSKRWEPPKAPLGPKPPEPVAWPGRLTWSTGLVNSPVAWPLIDTADDRQDTSHHKHEEEGNTKRAVMGSLLFSRVGLALSLTLQSCIANKLEPRQPPCGWAA